ncbi:MAG: hypothetical protein ACWA41_06665 [Putridiphycobacter sp.]
MKNKIYTYVILILSLWGCNAPVEESEITKEVLVETPIQKLESGETLELTVDSFYKKKFDKLENGSYDTENWKWINKGSALDGQINQNEKIVHHQTFQTFKISEESKEINAFFNHKFPEDMDITTIDRKKTTLIIGENETTDVDHNISHEIAIYPEQNGYSFIQIQFMYDAEQPTYILVGHLK